MWQPFLKYSCIFQILNCPQKYSNKTKELCLFKSLIHNAKIFIFKNQNLLEFFRIVFHKILFLPQHHEVVKIELCNLYECIFGFYIICCKELLVICKSHSVDPCMDFHAKYVRMSIKFSFKQHLQTFFGFLSSTGKVLST